MEHATLSTGFDPDCVDGMPLDFVHLIALHHECEFDEAIADDRVPMHELQQHRVST